MRKLIAYGLPLVALILSGCVTRVTPYEADRVDQELKGNRGVVRGKAADLPETERAKTKTIYNIEVELSSRELDKRKRAAEKKGNKGYVTGRKVSGIEPQPVSAAALQPVKPFASPQVVYQTPTDSGSKYKKEAGAGELSGTGTAQKTYVVQKGDTLQKISEKMYGTTKKWKKIFEANKNVLKNPDRIKAGQKLIIPAE